MHLTEISLCWFKSGDVHARVNYSSMRLRWMHSYNTPTHTFNLLHEILAQPPYHQKKSHSFGGKVLCFVLIFKIFFSILIICARVTRE